MHARFHCEGINMIRNGFPSLCGTKPINPHMKPGVKPGMKPNKGRYYETGYETGQFSANSWKGYRVCNRGMKPCSL